MGEGVPGVGWSWELSSERALGKEKNSGRWECEAWGWNEERPVLHKDEVLGRAAHTHSFEPD